MTVAWYRSSAQRARSAAVVVPVVLLNPKSMTIGAAVRAPGCALAVCNMAGLEEDPAAVACPRVRKAAFVPPVIGECFQPVASH